MKMRCCRVRIQPPQLQRDPCRTSQTRTHANGTIQFDAVFTVRAFGETLVLPFT